MVMMKIAWDLDECSFMFVALLKKKKKISSVSAN